MRRSAQIDWTLGQQGNHSKAVHFTGEAAAVLVHRALMQLVRKWFGSVLVMAFALSASAATKTDVKLVLDSDAARPGDTVMAGLVMKMPSSWHTYWRNSGDSGGPTEITWQLPPGITAGAIQWPVPEKLVTAGLTTYVYHDTVVLLIPLTIAKTAPNGAVEIAGKASWLECTAEMCLKGRGNVKASLTIGNEQKKSANAALISEWQKKLPELADNRGAVAMWEKEDPDQRKLIVQWNPANGSAEPDFYPFESKGYEILAPTEKLTAPKDKFSIRKGAKKLEGDWPAQITGLLIEKSRGGTKAFQVQMPVEKAGAAAAAGAPATVAGEASVTFWGALGFAFLGGLILNVMPCVLPVIALKILGFVQQSHQSPGEVRRLGFVYLAGVLVSFAVIAGIAISVQKAGRTAVWGSQFQDPRFIIVMATLMTLVALNLFGVFEVTLPGSAMGAASDLTAKHGALGAFFNGLLATALATSCTAPILAAALGFALATPQPPMVVMSMFLAMGLGLGSPYLVMSWNPKLVRFLPKPGPWMEKFKVLMGFPMLAVVLWLLSITAAYFGNRGPLWLGLFLLLLALAVWIWGEFVQRSSSRRGIAMGLALVLIAFGYGFCLEKQLTWRAPVHARQTAGVTKNSGSEIDWKPWSREAVEKGRAEGRPVLVDFTAIWCLSCQLIRDQSIDVAAVRAKIKETNALMLEGDFTQEDPVIAEELKRFNRSAVPLVLVYPRDPSRQPIILPNWPKLTSKVVLNALDEAVK